MAEQLELCALCRAGLSQLDQTPDPLILGLLGASAELPICPHPRGRGTCVLDRLTIREVVGFGGSSIVYRAFDPKRNGDVALKILLPSAARDPQWRRRFLAEGGLTELAHPHLASILEGGECGEWSYLLIEYCTGPSLASWLEARDQSAGPSLPAPLAARIVADLAATAHLHERGIVHRDITPNNVLLTDPRQFTATSSGFGYSVKLADFGLAKAAQREASFVGGDGATQSYALMGTPDYIAPELLRNGSRTADARSDIFSLGVLLYRLLIGHTPFRGRTPLETLRNIERCHVASLPRMRNGIARDIETIALKCLPDHPRHRYATAGQLHVDLNNFLAGRPILARRHPRIVRLMRFARRPAIAVPAAIALTLILILSAAPFASTKRARRT